MTLTHEEICAKMDVAKNMDFSRWTPRRVAEHLIAAGKRRHFKQPRYDFPGYYLFPYHLWLNCDEKEQDHPFKFSDHDAIQQLGYLLQGQLEFQDVQREYHAYLIELLTSTLPPFKYQKPERLVPMPVHVFMPADNDEPRMYELGIDSVYRECSNRSRRHLNNDQSSTDSQTQPRQAEQFLQSTPLPGRHNAQIDSVQIDHTTNVNEGAMVADANTASNISATPIDDGLVLENRQQLPDAENPIEIGDLNNASNITDAASVVVANSIVADFGPEDQQQLQQSVRRELNLPEAQDPPEHVRRMSRILSQDQREESQMGSTIEDIPIHPRIVVRGGRPVRQYNNAGNVCPMEQVLNTSETRADEVVLPPPPQPENIQPAPQINMDALPDIINEQQNNQPNATDTPNIILPNATLPDLHAEIDSAQNIENVDTNANANANANVAVPNGQRNTPLLNRAIRRLGRNRRAQSNTRKVVAPNMTVPIHGSQLEVLRWPEASNIFHPRIEPGLDLTMYYERILELLLVNEYIPIRIYTRAWNTESQRSNALTALCRMASDGIVKITKEDLGEDAPNQRIAGFEHVSPNEI